MERRKCYQVFVSSTYKDLIEERQEVYAALLRSSCIPFGMEYFPATNQRSLELIRDCISQCDYFVLISAGMYGSIIDEHEISYTEWEYNLAETLGKPVFGFVHADLNSLAGGKLERDTKPRELLEKFHTRIRGEGRNIRPYNNKEKLHAEVIAAMHAAPTRSPAVGWVRGDAQVQTEFKPLVGAWELIGSDMKSWAASRIIKIFSDDQFLWIELEKATGRVKHFISGTYQLTGYGDEIVELVSESTIASLVGRQQEYSISADDKQMTTEGERSTGVNMKEAFRRVDWPHPDLNY